MVLPTFAAQALAGEPITVFGSGQQSRCFGHVRDAVEAVKSRLHGDLHLGHVLVAGSDVMLTGFGAEPGRGGQLRRSKHSPLKDVASLLRSIDYAAGAALLRLTAERSEDLSSVEPLARIWGTVARAAFLGGYREGIAGCPVWPVRPGDGERLVTLFCLERALHETRDELTHRPDWAGIPLEGLLDLIRAPTSGDAAP